MTPCDPMDCRSPGFPVLHYLPEFAQTHVELMTSPNHPILCPLLLPSTFPSIRVFSNESALCTRWPKYACVCAKALQSCLVLCVPMACSLPGSFLSVGFPRQEHSSGLPSPPGDLPDPGVKPASLRPPALAGGFFTSATWGAWPKCMIPLI